MSNVKICHRVCLAIGLCAVVAPVLSEEIAGDPNAPVAAQVLGTVIRTADAEELRYLVLRTLTDRYADEKGIAVSQAETAGYVDAVERAMEQDRRNRAKRRDELARRLQTEGLPEAERKALAAELDDLNALAADPSEGADSPAEDPAEVKAVRDQVASAFVRQWKINRALYRDYGGRIIFQQGGPEPLDAYRLFLEERQRRGDFTISDPALADAFWYYYVTDSLHSVYPPGSAEEASAFASPGWLSD